MIYTDIVRPGTMDQRDTDQSAIAEDAATRLAEATRLITQAEELIARATKLLDESDHRLRTTLRGDDQK